MLKWLRARRLLNQKAPEIYGAVVAQARSRALYTVLGVPDTREGRYEMVVLHTFLVLERLRDDGESMQPLARAVAERFVADMDDSMRQFGVGDLSVPKKVKRAAAGLYDRTMKYRSAIENGESAFADALRAHAFEGKADSVLYVGLARYALACWERLRNQDGGDIEAGQLSFADPSDAVFREAI